MILKKDMLTKSLKKGRLTAESLLSKLSQVGGIPEPHYEYEACGSVKKPLHFFKVRFRVPHFINGDRKGNVFYDTIHGAGRCTTKQFAKSLAALEAVHRLEEELDVQRGSLQNRLDDYLAKLKRKQEELEAFPVNQQLPGVSWENIPIDASFSETLPAGRLGRLEFFPQLVDNVDAFTAAKAITLTSEERLPTVDIHVNHSKTKELQRWANIRAAGIIKGVVGVNQVSFINLDNKEAMMRALELLCYKIRKEKNLFIQLIIAACDRGKDSSFGMAKLFVSLPKHQFSDLKLLLGQVQDYEVAIHPQVIYKRHRGTSRRSTFDDGESLKARIISLRAHQTRHPLPIDSVEATIPDHVDVTIVRGGTGSGKTTRYPLMLSLFSPTGDTKTVVAQPRRLACQTAAHRVAYEQGFRIGTQGCPVGYAIRFESFPASAHCRTIDFQTPGVLLCRATEDPLLSDVTHLCLDEIHERNADVDLLLALAKQAMKERAQHQSLPPLRLILMSATLDSARWESYFRDDIPNVSIAVVDVPNIRSFPIETVHVDEPSFPLRNDIVTKLLEQTKRGGDFDDMLSQAIAGVVVNLISKDDLEGGSILCFLPGMEEIRSVHRYIREQGRRYRLPRVVYLHSSLSSSDQAQVFEPGQKIILSTNIAETSVTIPDVKVVIDSGRERQSSLLGVDSSSESDSAAVVGSQLVTLNISQASAKQRSGRAGRVSAGTCYRLYTRKELETEFVPFATPEMLRMDLSQLVLHSISLFHPSSGHPLSLLLGAPDPPTKARLRQTLRGLAFQGLVHVGDEDGFFKFDASEDESAKERELTPVGLTALGRAVNDFPVLPRIGRMLFLGLVLRAVDPALTIAALLSVPKVFSPSARSTDNYRVHRDVQVCSDIVVQLEAYQKYLEGDDYLKANHPKAREFNQVTRVRLQLERAMKAFLRQKSKANPSKNDGETNWNANGHRVAAQVGLICGATPHIAHLVNGKSNFATRDVAGNAKIHPTSVNFGIDRRAHWYVYHELRATKAPYLHVTTAASPLEMALFSDASCSMDPDVSSGEDDIYERLDDLCNDGDWLFLADQWVPVAVSSQAQRQAFVKLRRLLMHDMLQQVAQDPTRFSSDPLYEQIVLFVLSALEQQRIIK